MKIPSPKFTVTNNILASANTVARAKNEILSALKIQTKVILLTGEAGKGKSILLRSVASTISHNHRLIFFDGQDSASSSNDEYKLVESLICDSNRLDERIIIIIDAAEQIPEQTLTQFLLAVTASKLKNNNLSVLLSGLPECVALLKGMQLKQLIAHSSLDTIGEEDLRFLSAKKDYQIKPNRDEYTFEADAIKRLADYVNNDLKLADVALEWCIAIANQSDTDILSGSIINEAIDCIQQHSIDHNIEPAKAYPSLQEVTTQLDNSSHIFGISEKIKTSINATAHKSSRSNSTTDAIDLTDDVIPKLDFETDVELDLGNERMTEAEVIPQEWITTTKKMQPERKAAYITGFTLCALIVVSFVAIKNKPFIDNTFSKIESVTNKQAASTQAIPETTNSEFDSSVELSGAKQENSTIYNADSEKDNNEIDIQATTNLENIQAKENLIDKAEPLLAKRATQEINTDKQSEQRVFADFNEANTNKPNKEVNAAKVSPKTKLETLPETSIETLEDKSLSTTLVKLENSTIEQVEPLAHAEPTNRDIEIDTLLDLASIQFEAKQLTTPPGDNALDTFKQILALQPEHKLAQQGIGSIHARYLNWANYYLKQNETARSKYFYEKAFEIDPSDLASKQMAENLGQELGQTEKTAIPDSDKQEVSHTTISNNSPFDINSLLAKARQQFRDKQLTTPANNNAYETYKEVLKVEPENVAAIQGISQIKKSYINWAETDVQQNELRRAALFYRKALEIDPQDTKIARRLDEITTLSTTN